MLKIGFCFLLAILLCGGSLAVPTSARPLEIARVFDAFDLNTYSSDHEIIKHLVHGYFGHIRNYLGSVRSIAKATQKVLEEEFNIHKWQSSQSSMDVILRNVYDSCFYVQQFVNTTESTLLLPAPSFGSDPYIYQRAYYGLKSTIATMREVAAEIVKSYRYYVPEVTFTRCMGKYVTHTHPEWVLASLAGFPIAFGEYAYEMVNDFVKTFQNTNLELEHKNVNAGTEIGDTSSVQDLLAPQLVWAFEQLLSDSNEISQSGEAWQYRELNSKLSHLGKYLLRLFSFDEIAAELFGDVNGVYYGTVETPMKCVQRYAVEFLWNRADLLLSR